MNETYTGDLTISGNGSTAGGHFQQVKINGNGKINGDIQCSDFQSNGSSNVTGNLIGETILVKGSTKIYGDVQGNRIEVSGTSSIEGKVDFQMIEVKGAATIGKGMTGEQFFLQGTVKVGGDCQAEKVQLDGGFSIEGLLNADQITIGLHGRSRVKEIGCETIVVKKASSFFGLDKLIKSLSRELNAELIEGDDIDLEYTTAKIVRGQNIRIGPGCHIDLVEYKGDFQQDLDAHVNESKKI
ncbi:polymer-forming cytoskeletal protein [Alkalihalobacterium chitinilyticum]|uniref:Polymer-forming cytoskeletal protein n=1 Tax=Alkalihalobacterium chitinilyticum TaxID=2980103 RepID=A0ABT5VDK4_9BACI|nr:polymer-forming cytoskeletal protein [Alkalihalobacterium chitinilyticum]MDE5413539.1 polymer-forming cytoskeletal protein [Alkalihalobacterium chitinilyticum]